MDCFFFQAEDGIRDICVTGVQNVCSSDLGLILLDGSLFDATERKAAEEKLRAAEARYRSLVETLPLVTYARSLRFGDGNLYVSPQVEDILGTPVDEWIDRKSVV